MPHLLVLSRPYILLPDLLQQHTSYINKIRTIKRSYQTHSLDITLKITRLVRRFLLRRRNMSSSKTHFYYIIISTELEEKHTIEPLALGIKKKHFLWLRQENLGKNVCPFLFLKNPVPLSPLWGDPFSLRAPDSLSIYLRISSVILIDSDWVMCPTSVFPKLPILTHI